MRRNYGCLLLLAAVLASPLVNTGCAVRARYYDPDHGDYHRWNHGEVVYYNQWEVQTHRDHRDFKQRNADEQRDYWKWRHDHDHDHH